MKRWCSASQIHRKHVKWTQKQTGLMLPKGKSARWQLQSLGITLTLPWALLRMETCHHYRNVPANQNAEKRTLMQSHTGKALYSTFKWKNYKEISKIVSEHKWLRKKRCCFFSPSISFKELNRFLKSLPLRNNFPLNSPFGINNVRMHFYEVLNGKFRIQVLVRNTHFPWYSTITVSLNKGNKLSQHLYRKLKKKNLIYFGNLPNQDTFSMCLVM